MTAPNCSTLVWIAGHEAIQDHLGWQQSCPDWGAVADPARSAVEHTVRATLSRDRGTPRPSVRWYQHFPGRGRRYATEWTEG